MANRSKPKNKENLGEKTQCLKCAELTCYVRENCKDKEKA
jgi:hypothetical protein